jgi:hypothetical protein
MQNVIRPGNRCSHRAVTENTSKSVPYASKAKASALEPGRFGGQGAAGAYHLADRRGCGTHRRLHEVLRSVAMAPLSLLAVVLVDVGFER